MARARRAIACAAVRLADDSLAELRYWDASPECVASPDPETAESVEAALDMGGGWAILEDSSLGTFEPAKIDCTQMVILSGDSPSVSWSYRVGSEPVRTVDVPLVGLATKLGSPLGNPLLDLP